MRRVDLLQRELSIVFGARVTWLVLACSALLVGHSFVLAIDLFSAASRSAIGLRLTQREMDPLLGVVRPTLGGIYLSGTLLVPVLAARGLAVERERGSYGALALAVGGTTPVVLAKALAAVAPSFLLLMPVAVLCALYRALGGHVDVPETLVALFGHGLHLAALTGVSLAAASATRTVAQATTVAIGLSLVSWAIDAGEGFAALAWLGDWQWASVSRQLDFFGRGVVSLGAIAWFVLMGMAALLCAVLAGRFEPDRRLGVPAIAVAIAAIFGLRVLSDWHRGYDWSEQRRASLPPAVVEALRALPVAPRMEVLLDREDGRRVQLNQDVLAKLRLARPDITIDAPLDRRVFSEPAREEGYGKIVVHIGPATRETRSTNRREIVGLIFETSGQSLPSWAEPPYPGFPTVIAGARRSLAVAFAYLVQPLIFMVLGRLATSIRRSPHDQA